MLREAIYHKPWGAFAYLLDPESLSLTLRAKKGDLKSCQLNYDDPWESGVPFEKSEMQKVAVDGLFDFFRIVIKVPSHRRLRYAFYLEDDSEHLWFTEAGFSSKKPEPKDLGIPFFEFLYLRENDAFITPHWAKKAIFYQIFPDRFYDGDETNGPPDIVEWGKLPVTHETFYGGDLKGITEKLPYLNDLGINAIYLTPIFEAPTNHKYDTADYYKIDPHFGDLRTFKRLVKKCHESNIRIILDGAFDHCGYDFWAFQDVIKNEAKSKYKEWFRIYSFPIRTQPKPSYETWGNGIWRLPRLRTSNPEVKKYLIDVAVYWIEETDIDGWRLDTATEIDHDFWRDLRKAVKATKPEALLMGEVSHDASPWLDGDQLDSVMNYPFRDIMIDFFAKGSIHAAEFDARLANLRMQYRQQVDEVLYNLLGSHDTARFLSLCNNNVRRMMCCLLFQMTYVGMPAIYYGDEVGMTSASGWDDNRRAMIWDPAEQNKRLLDFYRKLIMLRKANRALSLGDFVTLHVDSKMNTYAYLRSYGDDHVIVALNNSRRTQKIMLQVEEIGWAKNVLLSNLLNNERHGIVDGRLHVSLKPYTAAILSK